MWVEGVALKIPQIFSVGIHPRESEENTEVSLHVWKGSNQQGKDKQPRKGCTRAWCIKQRKWHKLHKMQKITLFWNLQSSIQVIPSRNWTASRFSKVPLTHPEQGWCWNFIFEPHPKPRRNLCHWEEMEMCVNREIHLLLGKSPHAFQYSSFSPKLWLLNMGRMFTIKLQKALEPTWNQAGRKGWKIKPSFSAKCHHVAEL